MAKGQNKAIDMTGQRFGMLAVLKRAENVFSGGRSVHATWVCLCDCGNIVTVRGYCLRSGNSTSCGCKRKVTLSEISSTHRKSHTRLYKIWSGIKKRCNNPASSVYKHYGGRGISYSREWERFEPFYRWAISNGYSDTLSIDRVDFNGNYEPSNCRWVNDVQQANNTRTNRYITYKGVTLTTTEWYRRLGITRSKWDWLMKCNDQNAQAIIAACAGEIGLKGEEPEKCTFV